MVLTSQGRSSLDLFGCIGDIDPKSVYFLCVKVERDDPELLVVEYSSISDFWLLGSRPGICHICSWLEYEAV